MKLKSKVQLNLPKTFNTINLEYHTYEKATFDQYLAASIVLHARTNQSINKYIDDLTGKGSLNSHFKRLIEKVSMFDEKSIKKILESSMYPVTKIDKSNKYMYYPYFDISVVNNSKYYKGNLKDYTKDELIKALMLDVNLINFNVLEKDESEKTENYIIEFDNDNLKLNIFKNEWLNFDYNYFIESYRKPNINIDLYRGKVKRIVEGTNWSILTESSFSSIVNFEKAFIDEVGDYCLLTNDYIRKVEIAYISKLDLYFYMEERIDFCIENIKYCDLALNYLIKNPIINEMKTKTLLNILNNSTDLLVQEVINYVLSRKESKDLALVGLKLIKNGLEKNWAESALNGIKQFAGVSEMSLIYRINNKLEYTISELVLIDNELLSTEHQSEKERYLCDRKNKINEIEKIIGIITSSGLREKAKSLKQSLPEVKKFTKFCNKYIGHLKNSIEELTDCALDNRLDDIKEFYDVYLKIKNMCDIL